MDEQATAEFGRTRMDECACGLQKIHVSFQGEVVARLCTTCDAAALAVVTGLDP